MIEYINVPRLIGVLVSAKMATLAELQETYGVEDAYNMLEILLVDQANERKARARVR